MTASALDEESDWCVLELRSPKYDNINFFLNCKQTFFLYPKNAPTKVIGVEMKSHMANKATRVPNGTAADEPFVQSIRFVMKKTVKRMLNNTS